MHQYFKEQHKHSLLLQYFKGDSDTYWVLGIILKNAIYQW